MTFRLDEKAMSMRASRINGSAFWPCTKAPREASERGDRQAGAIACRETDGFSDRERAAPAWTEVVSTPEHSEVPDDAFAQARAGFSEQEPADLALAVNSVDGANRLNTVFHNPPVPLTVDANERVAADSWWVAVLR